MSSYTYAQKTFKPTAPLKGSFPLDHEGSCKGLMIKYMRCLHENQSNNAPCRLIAKDYLGCRMDNELMTREEWSKLGFAENEENLSTART